MKKIISAVVLYLMVSSVAYAEVSQFVFTNEQRTVAPSTISESLTIQSQNSTSAQESIAETTDLVFQSSSATGEFLNSSGNPVSTTMSKNTANRTFYYRDSTAGTYTLTLTATGRESKKSFKATQTIVVGAGGVSSDGGDDSPPPPDTTLKDSGTSSHSSPSPVSDSKGVMSFEVSAGRKRFTSVASEVVFKAEPIKLSGVPENYIQYSWTFGDGTIAQGQIASHRYRFAGDYVVVLNATYSDKSAVSRTDVLVIDPVFDIAFVDQGGVRVTNKSSGEVNVGEWVIEGGRSRLEIPRDTIIEKERSVVFPYTRVLTGEDRLIFKNPLGQIVSEQSGVPVSRVAEALATTTVAPIAPPEPIVKIVYVEKPIMKKEVIARTPIVPIIESEKKVEQTDMLASVYSAPVKPSALDSFLWIPKKGWGMLSDLFK